jgi:putative hydrolase of the HAD superfamily
MRQPILMFDFGNVIGFFDYSEMFGRLGKRLGLSGEQFEAMIYDRGVAHLAREFERGSLSAEEFGRQAMGKAGLKLSFEEFESQWADIFTLNEPVAGLVAALSERGYTLLLGSNTNEIHARFYCRKFRETLAHFDHLVFSYEVGELKPDLSFYTACLQAVRAPAGSCIFIDDAPANVEGAKAAGMQAVLYRDTPGLCEELRRLGVEVPGIER